MSDIETEINRIQDLLFKRDLYEKRKKMRYSDTLAPWKQRFCVEYWELKKRSDKLGAMLKKWDEGTIDFTPTCSYSLLNAQYATMIAYRSVLLERSVIENIDLLKWKDEHEEE